MTGLRFNVADLLRAPRGTTRRVTIDDPVELDQPDVELISHVTGDLAFTRDHAGILVMGDLAARVRLECVRCLESFEHRVAFELADEFHPTVPLPGGPAMVTEDERDPATDIDANHVLDLSEVIRQGLLLALPITPLCKVDCKGLCAQCGTNLNKYADSCECEPPRDPRWAAIADMLDED